MTWDPKARFLVFIGRNEHPRGHLDFSFQETLEGEAQDAASRLILDDTEDAQWAEIIDLQTGMVQRLRKGFDTSVFVEYDGWKPIGQEDDE